MAQGPLPKIAKKSILDGADWFIMVRVKVAKEFESVVFYKILLILKKLRCFLSDLALFHSKNFEMQHK